MLFLQDGDGSYCNVPGPAFLSCLALFSFPSIQI